MTDPTASLQASTIHFVDDIKRKRKFWFKAIWISVAGVIIPPAIGFMGTIIGMMKTFHEVSEGGEIDSDVLARRVSLTLDATMWGFLLSIVAFLVLIGVLIRFFTLPKLSPKVEY